MSQKGESLLGYVLVAVIVLGVVLFLGVRLGVFDEGDLNRVARQAVIDEPQAILQDPIDSVSDAANEAIDEIPPVVAAAEKIEVVHEPSPTPRPQTRLSRLNNDPNALREAFSQIQLLSGEATLVNSERSGCFVGESLQQGPAIRFSLPVSPIWVVDKSLLDFDVELKNSTLAVSLWGEPDLHIEADGCGTALAGYPLLGLMQDMVIPEPENLDRDENWLTIGTARDADGNIYEEVQIPVRDVYIDTRPCIRAFALDSEAGGGIQFNIIDMPHVEAQVVAKLMGHPFDIGQTTTLAHEDWVRNFKSWEFNVKPLLQYSADLMTFDSGNRVVTPWSLTPNSKTGEIICALAGQLSGVYVRCHITATAPQIAAEAQYCKDGGFVYSNDD